MKLYILLILGLLLAHTCKSQFSTDSLIENRISIFINDIEYNMQLDTGASISVIKNTSKVGGVSYYSKLPSREEKINMLTRVVKEKSYAVPEITSQLGTVKDLSLLMLENSNRLQCPASLIIEDGIIGMDFLKKVTGDNFLELNYGDQKISVLKNDQIPLGFKEIKSRFDNKSIYLNLIINRKRQKVLFDTGSDGFLILKKRRFSKKDFSSIELESPLLDAGNGYIPNKTNYYRNIPLKMTGFTTDQSVVSINKDMFTNILGLPFIKNFNWLIDFKNEKIYAQQHSTEFDNSWLDKLDDINNLLVAYNNTLMIVYSKSGYSVGSTIKSVDDTLITEENICKYQNLLLKNNKDWSAFNIEFN